MELDKEDYEATITFSTEAKPDWEGLKEEMEAFEKSQRKKRKKK